ncbi:hypothetical protein L1887_21204 [Cichorium endivia]|nr:hypothetical protein L1887_21204 [Cichorium endivia]
MPLSALIHDAPKITVIRVLETPELPYANAPHGSVQARAWKTGLEAYHSFQVFEAWGSSDMELFYCSLLVTGKRGRRPPMIFMNKDLVKEGIPIDVKLKQNDKV